MNIWDKRLIKSSFCRTPRSSASPPFLHLWTEIDKFPKPVVSGSLEDIQSPEI